jgi:hypothetical protein
MLRLRLFIFVDGNEVAVLPACQIPRIGEKIWCKTPDYCNTLIVEDVEHQLDRSDVETYSNHDVEIKCREQQEKQ